MSSCSSSPTDCRSTLAGWLRRAADARRRHGTAAAASWIAYRLAQRLTNAWVARVLWLDRKLPNPRDPARGDYDFRFLTAEEVRQLADDRANDLEASLADRLAFGKDFCLAALDGGRLAAYAWFALEWIEPAHSAYAGIAYPADVAYLYKAYTHPDFRGRRLCGAVTEAALRALSERGVSKLLCLVEWSNEASLRSCRHTGWTDLGRLVTLGYGRCRLVFAPRNARERGVVFGCRRSARAV